MADQEDILEPVVQELFKIARRAQLGLDGKSITGAIVLLEYEEGVSSSHITGDLDDVVVTGRLMQMILDCREHRQRIEIEEAMERGVAMVEKVITGGTEH